MAKLSYKTKGNVSPQGKQKIYFACHPKDFDAYFEPICADIFATQNCAVLYNSEATIPWDKEEMRTEFTDNRIVLVVIPVTLKFLLESSNARDVELAYALENHIPVLPLMQDFGIENEYENVFGDLQFLDKNVSFRDPTVLPYDQKLKRYLESVLVGDKLAEKIRQAFDAYIFLSYRKKDRKHAQNLMRLIHQNDFCRDIAIWYDEYLVPGEHFTEAIRAALKRSELFTLVVTPSLLELNDKGEENYVVQNEYPSAVEAGKEILPVIMEKTNLADLHKKLDGKPNPGDKLPEATDYEDKPALSQALLNSLRDVALRENDNDPMHNFFIGLAYLGGIDVEIDHVHSVELITSAANDGLPEAMRKLADMYRTGEGVKRDYDTVVYWLKRIVELREEKYDQSGERRDIVHLYYDSYRVADVLIDMRRLSDALDYCKKMVYAAPEFSNGTDYCHLIAQASERISIIYMMESNFAEAKIWAKKYMDAVMQQHSKHASMAMDKDLCKYYILMSNICQKENDFSGAKEWCVKAIDLKEKDLKNWQEKLSGQSESDMNVKELGLKGFREELVVLYDQMNEICLSMSNISEAEEWSRKSTEIAETFPLNLSNGKHLNILASNYISAGITHLYKRNLSDARKQLKKGLDLINKLDYRNGSTVERLNLSIVYMNLGTISMIENNLSEAKSLNMQCLEIVESISSEYNSYDVCRTLARCYYALGHISSKEHEISDAREWYKNAISILLQLISEKKDINDRSMLSSIYEGMGNMYFSECNFEEAKKWYDESLAILRELIKESNVPKLYLQLSVACEKQGDVYKFKNNIYMMRALYVECLKIREDLASIHDDILFVDMLSNIYEKMGELCKAEDNFLEVIQWYEKCAKEREKMYKATKGSSERQKLINIYGKLGDFCMVECMLAEAQMWYSKKLELEIYWDT